MNAILRNSTVLSLKVPEPPARPGDPVDFSGISIPAAGSARRPDIRSGCNEMRDLAFDLVRVLDEENRAVGPWAPNLSPAQLQRALEIMLLTRAFDDRMHRMQRQGKTSFYIKCTGEEAVATAQALALDATDMVFPTYRQQAMLIARDYPLVDMMNQIYSNVADPCRGRQLPIMYTSKQHGFFSISGNLGTQCPQAVGWAMASAYKGDSRIACTYIGEGSTAEGDFHQACVFASVYHAPILLNIVNNQWAISSFAGISGGMETTYASKGIGYGIPSLRVDGNDLLAVFAATQWAVERARANLGPTLIEHFTYRASSHSTSDDPSRYRPAEEAIAWPLGDPIERLKGHMIAIGAWDDDRHEAALKTANDLVKAAGRQSEKIGTLGQSRPPVESMFDDVFETMPDHIRKQRQEATG